MLTSIKTPVIHSAVNKASTKEGTFIEGKQDISAFPGGSSVAVWVYRLNGQALGPQVPVKSDGSWSFDCQPACKVGTRIYVFAEVTMPGQPPLTMPCSNAVTVTDAI